MSERLNILNTRLQCQEHVIGSNCRHVKEKDVYELTIS